MPKYSFQCGRRAGRLGIPKNHLQKRKHVGFYMVVDGTPAHFLADPNASEETMEAFRELVRAAVRWMDEKAKVNGDE